MGQARRRKLSGSDDTDPHASSWRRSEREMARAADTEIVLAQGKGTTINAAELAKRSDVMKSPDNQPQVTKVGGKRYVTPAFMQPLLAVAHSDYDERVKAGFKGSFEQFLEAKATASNR